MPIKKSDQKPKPKSTGHGGQRFGAGRKPGSPNKSSKEIQELIRNTVDFEKLITSLGKRAMKGNIKAAKLLFEYGYGRPAQQLTIKTDEPIQLVKVQVVKPE